MDKEALIKYLTERCAFTVECENEFTPVRGNASAIDEETDKAAEDWIFSQLNAGNGWAWCTIKVTAAIRGTINGANYDFSASDYLGCCSYKSEADFMTEGGYYPDMKAAAVDNLANSIIADFNVLSHINSNLGR